MKHLRSGFVRALIVALCLLMGPAAPVAASPGGTTDPTTSPSASPPLVTSAKGWGDIDFSGYHTGFETAAILQNKSTKYPQIAKLVSIGKTWQGRDIWALKISDNAAIEERDEPEVYINAQHHAREWATSEVVLYMIDFLTSQYPADPRAKYLVENRQMWFIPLVNYDGRVQDSASDAPTSYYKGCSGDTGGAGWRKNMRDNDNSGSFNCGDGVDMNRNYDYDFGGSSSSGTPASQTYRGPSAFSEPETRALRDNLIGQHWFRNSITYHSFQQALLYVQTSSTSSFATPYAQAVTDGITNNAGSQQNGYSLSPGSGGSGQEHGAEFHSFQTVSMLIEIYPTSSDSMPAGHNGFHPPITKILPVAEDNFGGMLVALEHAANPFYLARYSNDQGVWGIYPFSRLAGNYTGDTFTIEAAVENYGTAAAQPDVRLQIFRDPLGANVMIHEQTKPSPKQLAQNESAFVPFTFTFTQNATYRVIASTIGGDNQAWNDGQESTFSLKVGGGGKQPPRVVSTSPAPNQTGVPVAAKLSVTFSKPMNSTATESSFSITPAAPGSYSWSTQSELVFSPSAPLTQSTTYTATISTAAKDMDGLNLQSPHSFSFTTETPPPPPAPQVVGTVPLSGAMSVVVSTTIQVTFSKDMDTPSVQSSFSILPPVATTISGSGKSFTWTPAQPLAKSTKYAATILGSVKDTQGIAMGSDYTFDFTTESGPAPTPPKVIKVNPADGTKDWSGKKGVDVEFSVAMDRTSAEAAFTLSPSVPGAWSWNAGGQILTFSPTAGLSPGATYVVKVDASAKDLTGTPMGSAFTSSFEAAIPPSISSIAPADGSEGVPVSTSIIIEFSEPMATSTVDSGLKISPSFGLDTAWDPAGSVLTITSRAALSEGTKYTVEIAQSATDVPGNSMAAPFSAVFTTASPNSPASPPATAISPILLAILLMAVVAVAAALAILAWRRRRKAPPAPAGTAQR